MEKILHKLQTSKSFKKLINSVEIKWKLSFVLLLFSLQGFHKVKHFHYYPEICRKSIYPFGINPPPLTYYFVPSWRYLWQGSTCWETKVLPGNPCPSSFPSYTQPHPPPPPSCGPLGESFLESIFAFFGSVSRRRQGQHMKQSTNASG